ncbi:uncharacterized protein N7498_001632 [Penicillium cinerascens]|uniref:Uncharacterized protein n=1 Tax=Penicillium cinerascens TaxID=70096 RepID=A0A9W9TB74_9EURO|nr:uncharacterized protein N7498_001632 [Penicillium cinerascens]KAJ5215225.1 hypothetical protein N7498_001632 [Penicillium cinerascens]
MAENESERISASPIRTAVETEIRTTEGHTHWRCRAVTVDPKNINRIRIACRDEDEHQLVKKVASMVVYLTKGTDARRLLADGFFHAGGESGVTSTFEYRP